MTDQHRPTPTDGPDPPRTERESDEPPPPPPSTLADSLMGFAPPVPGTVGVPLPLPAPETEPDELKPGSKIGKYTIKRRIGRGGLATVYLAVQESLEREVALKVSPNRGSEGRTMATLQHRNIVEVYDEDVDRRTDQRLLCMEVVRGASLEEILRLLRKQGDGWRGKDVLGAVGELAQVEDRFVPEALPDREAMEKASRTEAACRVIRQLAEALAHAHHHGVLHRDLKPGNVLLDRYGRVKLADFNISLDPERRAGARGEIFGGTLDYMAPEHLDAFNPATGVTPEAVDARSDLYAVGLIFFELLTGDLPFATAKTHASSPETLGQLAGERRSIDPAVIRARVGDEGLATVVLRCLDPDPAKRFPDAGSLEQAVADCLERQRLRDALPPLATVGRFIARNPILGLVLLAYLPNLVAAVVNILYNRDRIVVRLPEVQQVLFDRMWIVYNGFAHPICIALMLYFARPWFKLYLDRLRHRPIDLERFGQVRRQVLRWPMVVAGLTLLGWGPGALYFPLGLHLLGGGVGPEVFLRFFYSFALSALIAGTYAVLGVRFTVLRILYPDLLVQTPGLAETTRRELPPPGGNWLTLLAGLIPLSAAAVLLILGAGDLAGEHGDLFRYLLIALIVLGMCGVYVAATVQAYLDRTLLALRRQTAEQKVE